jgi:glucose/arabinose dehydrogenase
MPVRPQSRRRLLTMATLAMLAASLPAAALPGQARPPAAHQARPPAAHQAQVADPARVRVSFVPVATAAAPVAVTFSPDLSDRLFVVEQAGRVRVVDRRRRLLAEPYLDISGRVAAGGERGLFSIAFHPRFSRNGRFFLAYTDAQGDLRVSRFQAATPGSNAVSVRSERVLLDIAHRDFANHNGGQLAFGPDGYLYVSTGDGGGGGDPHGNAMNRTRLLGKILRIDVDHTQAGRPYAIPSTNPYARNRSLRPEIWHYGLRNAWRFSFDRFGSLWVADVGQNAREEVNVVLPRVGNRNFGWDCREGTLDTVATYGGEYCASRTPTFTGPLHQYDHQRGRCSITGGYRYRGRTYRSLLGDAYLYGDLCSGQVWALVHLPAGPWKNAQVGSFPGSLSSFGESRSGELYATDVVGGGLYRVTARRA